MNLGQMSLDLRQAGLTTDEPRCSQAFERAPEQDFPQRGESYCLSGGTQIQAPMSHQQRKGIQRKRKEPAIAKSPRSP